MVVASKFRLRNTTAGCAQVLNLATHWYDQSVHYQQG